MQAEERGVHALGSWGSSSHRRSLLQLAPMMVAENTAFMEMENADSEPPLRDSPDERGQGKHNILMSPHGHHLNGQPRCWSQDAWSKSITIAA